MHLYLILLAVQCGGDLGIDLQFAAHLLAVLGAEQTTGMSLGTDLEKQKPTLPIIRALQLASASDRQAILDIVSGDDRQPKLLGPFLDRYEAIDYTRHRALSFSTRARRRLEALPASPSRDVLAAMTEFVVRRSM